VCLRCQAPLTSIVNLAPPVSERPELIQFLSKNRVHLVHIISAAEDPKDGFKCFYVDDRDAASAG